MSNSIIEELRRLREATKYQLEAVERMLVVYQEEQKNAENWITAEEAVSKLKIKTKYRGEEIAARRFLFWQFMKLNTTKSYANIGKMTGHHHSTVIHGIRMAEIGGEWMKRYRMETEKILESINLNL